MMTFRTVLMCLSLIFPIGCSGDVTSVTPHTIHDLADQLDKEPFNTRVRLLFVLSATEGIVGRVGKTDNHVFSFKEKYLSAAIAFTDRPQRYAFDMSLSMFQALWKSGKDSFRRDPPNAVLKADGSPIAITILRDLNEAEGILSFRLDRNAYKHVDTDGKLTKVLRNPTLVIDASILTAAGLAGLLRAGAQACVEVECYWALAGA
jgi:hypothetical protein